MGAGDAAGPGLKDNIDAAAGKGIAFVHIVPHFCVLGPGIAVGIAVAVNPIPACPNESGVAQLIGGHTDNLGPAFPVIPKGAHHIISPQPLVHRGVAFPPEGVVPQFVAGLAEHYFDALAPPGRDLLHLLLIGVDGQLRVGGAAPVDVVFGRVVGRVGVRAPYVPRPQAGGYCGKHLVVKSEGADIAARAEGTVHQHNAAVADGADGVGGLDQKAAIFRGVGLAAPLHIQIGFIPNLHIKFEAVPPGQIFGDPLECLGQGREVGRFFPVVAVKSALQADDRLQASVIGPVDEIDPALLGAGCIRANVIKHLLDIAVPTDEAVGPVQLPVQIALVAAAFLHKGVDAKIGIVAPGRERHGREGEGAPTDGGIGGADQRVVDAELGGAGAIGKAGGQGKGDPKVRSGCAAAVDAGDLIGDQPAGSEIGRGSPGADGENRGINLSWRHGRRVWFRSRGRGHIPDEYSPYQ